MGLLNIFIVSIGILAIIIFMYVKLTPRNKGSLRGGLRKTYSKTLLIAGLIGLITVMSLIIIGLL
jgi:hypothetical protein